MKLRKGYQCVHCRSNWVLLGGFGRACLGCILMEAPNHAMTLNGWRFAMVWQNETWTLTIEEKR